MRMKNNNRGFTLIELMVVVGIIGAMSLVVVNLTTTANKTSTKFQFDTDMTSITAEISKILSSPRSCQATISTSTSIANIQNVPDTGAAVTKYPTRSTGAPAGGYGAVKLEIESYSLGPIVNNGNVIPASGTDPAIQKATADLTINFLNKKILRGTTGSNTISKIIKLDIDTTPAGTIISCTSATGGIAGAAAAVESLIGSTDNTTPTAFYSFFGKGAAGILVAGDDPPIGVVTGLGNTGFGFEALKAITLGQNNVAFGYKALTANTAGEGNTAVGFEVMLANNGAGMWSSAEVALLDPPLDPPPPIPATPLPTPPVQKGSQNTATGYHALAANISGIRNTAFGYESLAANTGSGNTAFGYQSLQTSTSGVASTAFGYQALLGSGSPSNYNTAFGYQSLFSNTIAEHNVGIGHSALYSATEGGSNVAIGDNALYSNQFGVGNTAVGKDALKNNTASNNTAVGFQALDGNGASLRNTAVGAKTLSGTAIQNDNTFVGDNALWAIDSNKNRNTGVGVGTFIMSGGDENTGFGFFVGLSTTTGKQNVAVGFETMQANVGGNYNVAIGDVTIHAQAVATNNYYPNGGGRIYDVLNTIGDYNIAIGHSALSYAAGSGNIAIGAAVMGTSSASNSTYIGMVNNDPCPNTNNSLVLSAGFAQLWSCGNDRAIHFRNYVVTHGLMLTSDARLKKDIKIIPDALEKLLTLNGVSFNWDNTYFPDVEVGNRPQLGVIAQQVEKVFPAAVTTGDKGIKHVAYDMLIAPIIESIKTLYRDYVLPLMESNKVQERQLASLQERNDHFKKEKDKEVAAMNARLDRLEKELGAR